MEAKCLQKKTLIVGAGPGGLSAGMILAKRGFSVTILEKENLVGGRNGSIKKDMASTERSEGRRFLLLLFFVAVDKEK